MIFKEKDYVAWMSVKTKLHRATLKAKPHHAKVSPREILWVSIGENVGHEQDGKGKTYTRPALIYKVFNVNLAIIIPLTTRVKQDQYHFNFMLNGAISSALLSQIRVCDTARLGRWPIGKISATDFKLLRQKLLALLS